MRAFVVRFAVLFMLGLSTLAPRVAAADLRDHAESLKKIPADASFYAAWLKNAEQITALQATNAWKKLTTIPGIQLGLMQAQTQWQFPSDPRVQMVKEWVESEAGGDVLAVLREMASDEVFFYGDQSLAAMIELLVKINAESNRIQFGMMEGMFNQAAEERAAEEGLDDEDFEEEDFGNGKLEESAQAIIDLIAREGKGLVVPDVVIGFRVSDRERASKVLAQGEALLRAMLEQQAPELIDLLSRTRVDGADLLTLTFTADRLPWDEIEENLDGNADAIELVEKLVAGKQAVLAIGLVDDFVVVSLGDSTDHLVDAAGSLLADRPEFKRLDRHADEDVLSIGYVSEVLMRALNSNKQSFEDLAVMGKAMVGMTGADDERQQAIKQDIDGLIADVLQYLPEPGAVAAVTFGSERGYESFSYSWAGMAANQDASQKLTLLEHVGAESLAWFAARGKSSVEQYDELTGWLRRGFDHFEAIAKQSTGEDEWEQYTAARDKFMPLVKRVDEAYRESLIPGFADGQGAIVLDASIADDTWCEYMPPAGAALPLPTPAFVYGVSDAGLVKRGVAECFAVANDTLAFLADEAPNEFPMNELPAPTVSQDAGGTVYTYDLPAEAGANSRVAPNAVLGERALVLSALPELGSKLAAGSPPTVDGPAAEFDRPLFAAWQVRLGAMIDIARPWIDYGVQRGIENADEEAAQMVPMIGFIKPQAEQAFELLKVFDSWNGVIYREDDAWVTHGELRIIDVED